MSQFDYIRDPEEIYRQSFATVESEADLLSLPPEMRPVATRMIHSCGMINLTQDIDFSEQSVGSGRTALEAGRPVFCDVEMVRSGIIERLLPAGNKLICKLGDSRVADHAKVIGNTRSAAAVDFWSEELEGALAVIGNAPTALFRLLERIGDGGPKPALVVGIPVGFVGAVESKKALAENTLGLDFITVNGRRGGSAMASSVINALAGNLG